MSTKVIVVDTSVIVKWLNSGNEQGLIQSQAILEHIEKKSVVVLAPELAKYEVGNALINKKLAINDLLDSIDVFHKLTIRYFAETERLAIETAKVARECEITYYDASFIALAKQENATLVTANSKHQKKVVGVKVVSLEDYK